MNYDENLTYDWLYDLRKKRVKTLKEEEAPTTLQSTGSISPEQRELLLKREEEGLAPRQEIADRALAAYNSRSKWRYYKKGDPSAKPSPNISPEQGAICDCTGFSVWAWKLRGSLVSNSVRLTNPGLGYAIWYDPCCPDIPPSPENPDGIKYYGHSGIIVKMHPDGNYDTVDCSSSSKGLRYKQRSKGWWTSIAQGKPIEYYRPKTVPPSINDVPYYGGGDSSLASNIFGNLGSPAYSFGDRVEYSPFRTFLSSILKEEKIRNYVSGRNAALAQDVGIIDVEFESGGDDSIIIDPSWISSNITRVSLINGSSTMFHVKYADQLKAAFENACRATGWTPEDTSKGYCPKPNGGFVPRRSRAASEKAKPVEQREIGGHAWGTSIDLGTASENPYGGGGVIRKYPEFIEAMKQNGFIWGGDWSMPDDMHFEVKIGSSYVSPAQYSSQMYGAGAETGTQVQFGDRTEYSPFRTFLKGFLNEGVTKEDKIINKEKKFKINDKTKDKLIYKNKKLLSDMLSFFDNKLKFEKPVLINFIEDRTNSKKPLGKTAYYHPENYEITVFTTNRILKDILRSVGHELIHHKQHCKSPFNMDNTQEGYAQKDKNMRKKEKEAYLYGNIIFRDWEDNYKKKHRG